MDSIKLEVQEGASEAQIFAAQREFKHLNDLQLALVGGGSGETVFD